MTCKNFGERGFFDFKMGAIGATGMAAAVFYVNHEYGADLAAIAAMKQATYTFLVGSTITRLCENLAVYFDNKHVAKAMAVLVPSAVTLALTYAVHSLRGTPDPLGSTIPTAILAPPAFAYWGHRKRNQLEALVLET